VPGDRLVLTVHTTSMGEARSLWQGATGIVHRLRALSRRTVGVMLDALVIRKARRIIAISPHIADELVRDYGVARDRIEVIGNGVDCAFFSPEPTDTASDRRELRALYVGRLEPRKNVGLLLEALACLPSNVVCRIIGTGKDEERLRKEGARLGLGNRVEFRGHCAGAALVAEYRWADVFVMPSIYEGMPLTVLEAKACGLSVISAPFKGASAIIPDGTGVVLANGSAELLQSTLELLLHDYALRRDLGAAARADALARFSWDAVLGRVAGTLRSVASATYPSRSRSGGP
jgi:glycosyltransferase involved in cell wall biosynthesis